MSITTDELLNITEENIDDFENLTIVWLDETINNTNMNDIIWSKRQNLLEDCISSIKKFIDKDECIKYISNNINEHIFLIVSGSIGEIILEEIHSKNQICQIYIFCYDIIKHNQWSKSYKKVCGVFNDENILVNCLEKDLKMYSKTLIPINITQLNERSLKDIDEEQVSFIWLQLMIEVISHLSQSLQSKQDMIDECRKSYCDNKKQLSYIEDFYNNYNSNSAINWYTKDTFLYKLLNKAFRTENIDIIFNYHYFIKDLTKEITDLYIEQYKAKKGILTVYRGQHLHIKELEKIQNSIGHLMSINTFFSTSTSSSVATNFSGNGEYQNQGFESVIFQIDIDLAIGRCPFANIKQSSQNTDENEILFSIGSIFSIENVELFTDYIWLIQLTLTDKVKKEIDDLLKYFTKHIGIQPTLLELGVILSKIGDFERAQRFYARLENELPSNHDDLGVLYNNIGEIYRKQGYTDKAMKYYIMSIDQLLISFDFFDPWFAIVHSNIGMIYFDREQYDEALVSYQCALSILEYYQNGYEELLSTIYNGIATVYQKKDQLELASIFYEKTLKIEEKIYPLNHPSLSTTYNNIGHLYCQMKNYTKSLEYFFKCLPNILSTLPDNHYQLVIIYASIGSIYRAQDNISDAVQYLIKAQEVLDRSTLSLDHKLREEIYGALTLLLYENKMIDLSINMNKKLIEVYKSRISPDQYYIAFWTWKLAILFDEQKHYEKSFECQELSLNIIENLPRTEKNKDLYLDIIEIIWRSKHFHIAIEHYTRLLNEEIDQNSLFFAKINNNLGVLYDHMENNPLALGHYRTALQIYENHQNISDLEIAIIYYNVTVILNNLSDYRVVRISRDQIGVPKNHAPIILILLEQREVIISGRGKVQNIQQIHPMIPERSL